MSTDAGATLTAVIGVLLTRLALEGTFRRYVRPGMGPWLAVAGVLLALLGVIVLWRNRRGHDDHSAHEHGGERVAWLLLAPVLALLLDRPPTARRLLTRPHRVGGDGEERWRGVRPARTASRARTRCRCSSSTSARSRAPSGASFNGATVRVIGFVGPDDGRGVRRRSLLDRLLRGRRPRRDGPRDRLAGPGPGARLVG